MKESQAVQIAELLNTRNQLPSKYTSEKVLNHSENYLIELHEDKVVACVEVKKVQWYQWEVRHLSVSTDHTNKGLGKQLIRRAEKKAREEGARVVQCTIRVGNVESEQAFRRSGYHEVCCFYNSSTEKYIAVWQKVLSYLA